MARTPRHVIQFRDALLAVRPREISIPGTRPGVVGVPGIREATRLQYNRDDFQSLGRMHEYSFALPNGHILELSVQFYLNNIGYWRLFAYSVVDGTKAHGMLFSVNITMGHDGSDIVQLKQRLALSTRGLTVDQRRGSTDEMAAQLRQSGLTIEDRNIVFTPFNTKSGKFDGGTASAFVRDFVVTAVLKGHYMANKGYSLPVSGLSPSPIRAPSPLARSRPRKQLPSTQGRLTRTMRPMRARRRWPRSSAEEASQRFARPCSGYTAENAR